MYQNGLFEKKNGDFRLSCFAPWVTKKVHNSTNHNISCLEKQVFCKQFSSLYRRVQNYKTKEKKWNKKWRNVTTHTDTYRGAAGTSRIWINEFFFSSKISTDFYYTRWQTLFWIWILFNHGRDNISISHHKVWSIAFWSLKFTGHLSILLDIFSTVFRQEEGTIWTRTQNLFPSFTVRRASIEPGKKTYLNNAPFSSLNWSNTRSNPWRRSVKWLFISSRLIICPPSSQKETVGVNLKTKANNTQKAVCSILLVFQK